MSSGEKPKGASGLSDDVYARVLPLVFLRLPPRGASSSSVVTPFGQRIEGTDYELSEDELNELESKRIDTSTRNKKRSCTASRAK